MELREPEEAPVIAPAMEPIDQWKSDGVVGVKWMLVGAPLQTL